MEEYEAYWLWLCMIPGLYRSDKKKLLDLCVNPAEIYKLNEKQINGFTFLNDEAKQNLLAFTHRSTEEFIEKLRRKQIRFYSYKHDDYPEKFLELPDYPYGIFVKGHLPEQHKRCVAIVGSRKCTNYGRKMAGDIAEALAERNVSIVSGLAMGIDGIAQSTCINRGQDSYAIVGSGVDICYPREHFELYQAISKQGGIISEYPPETTPYPSHFPQRNRLISGLSDMVIVIEAQKKSGSLITADLALEQGRDVYAVPGRISDVQSVGCNNLIAQGAGIITDVNSLLEAMNLDVGLVKKSKKQKLQLQACENMVYLCLDYHGKSIEELVAYTQYKAEEVMTALMMLQIKGLAIEISSNCYVLK